jgi:hypothetical protein
MSETVTPLPKIELDHPEELKSQNHENEIFFEKAHRFLFAGVLGVFLCLPAFSDLWPDYWILKALTFLVAGLFAMASLCLWLFTGRFFDKTHTVSGIFILCASYSGIAMGLLELFARFDRDLKSFMPGSEATVPVLLLLPAFGLLILTGAAYFVFRFRTKDQNGKKPSGSRAFKGLQE